MKTAPLWEVPGIPRHSWDWVDTQSDDRGGIGSSANDRDRG